MKTKIGTSVARVWRYKNLIIAITITEVAHVTRDSNTTFEVKRSNVKVTGQGYIVAQLVSIVVQHSDARISYYYCKRSTLRPQTSAKAAEPTISTFQYRPYLSTERNSLKNFWIRIVIRINTKI